MNPFKANIVCPSRISNQVGLPAKYKPETLQFELINSVAETEGGPPLSTATSNLIS